MPDRLEVIKTRWGIGPYRKKVDKEWVHRFFEAAANDMDLLISEVERLRVENEAKQEIIDNAERLVKKVQEIVRYKDA